MPHARVFLKDLVGFSQELAVYAHKNTALLPVCAMGEPNKA
jgi:hypothetical protein